MNTLISASRAWRSRLLMPAVTLTLILVDRSAHACEVAGLAGHTLDPGEQAVDTQLPAAPKVSNVDVKRGVGPRSSGCGGMTATSCDDIGTIHLMVSSIDDRTAAPDIGYRLSIASGSPPSGLDLPTTDVRANSSDGLVLHWIDGATDDQESVDFELRISSVDRAGNVSATDTVVRVQSKGDGGCGVARASHGGPGRSLLFIALTAMAWARRRRPPRRR